MTDSVPAALSTAHLRWTAAGRPAQPSTGWMPHSWTPRLPEHADYLVSLPNPITRNDVTARFVEADRNADDAVRAFLAAMVWGHGRNGYGAYRTARVLAATDETGARLLEAMRLTRAQGGPAGFSYLRRHRLKGLGVAFATKYLYFCIADSDTIPPAPILDSVVRRWLDRHTGWQPRLDWRIEDYERYCALVQTWSVQLDETPSTVEYLMFANGIGIASQWSDPRLTASGIDAVLYALTEAATAYDALPAPDTPTESEAFHQAIESLRQLALTRAQRQNAVEV